MNDKLKKSIELYVELLEKLARRKNLTTEQAVENLVTIGMIISKEEAYVYENNLINPLHD